MATERRRPVLLAAAASAAAGFVLAAALFAGVLRASGFDWICLHQVLCSVSMDLQSADQIHLSWRDDPARSLTVTWWLPDADTPAIVEYRRDGETSWQQAAAVATAVPANGIVQRRGAYWRATLAGLEPDTMYEYRVSNASGAAETFSMIFAARTAPEGPEAEFSFMYFSDSGLEGRPDGLSGKTGTIRDFIAAQDLDFLLGGGDYGYGNADGRYVFPPDAGDEWFRQWQPVLTRLPLMAQYGNHEVFLRENLSDWAPRFGHPAGFEDGRAYSFDVGAAHFTAMFAPGDGFLPSDELLRWLDEDLRQARERGATWLIVFQHDSLFGHGLSHPADPRLRALMMPILERHDVDLHLGAQDQSYERSFPLRGGPDAIAIAGNDLDTYVAGEGVIYVKVSPAGKMSERTDGFSLLTAPQPPEIARRSDDGHHIARVDVRGTQELVVTILKWRPGDSTPTVLEAFSITREAAP